MEVLADVEGMQQALVEQVEWEGMVAMPVMALRAQADVEAMD